MHILSYSKVLLLQLSVQQHTNTNPAIEAGADCFSAAVGLQLGLELPLLQAAQP